MTKVYLACYYFVEIFATRYIVFMILVKGKLSLEKLLTATTHRKKVSSKQKYL